MKCSFKFFVSEEDYFKCNLYNYLNKENVCFHMGRYHCPFACSTNIAISVQTEKSWL